MDHENELVYRSSGRAAVGAPAAHGIGSAQHTPSTLAELNALISDGTLKSGADITAEIAAAIVGLLSNQGGYDAATNVPDLDTAPSGILEGYAWFVTAAGPFFTEDLEIGDLIYAKIDNPTALSDWVRLEHNLLPATTTVAGIVKLAVDGGTVPGTAVDASDSRLPAIVLNTTHRTSDGKDHSDVVLNNTHRASDGSDHTFIDQDVTSGSSPTLDGANITGLPTTAYDNDSVTNGKLAEMAANTVKANNTGGSGNPIDLALTVNNVLGRAGANIQPIAIGLNTVLGRVGADIVAAQVVETQIADNAVANGKLADMPSNTIKVNNTGSAGDPVDLELLEEHVLRRNTAGNIESGKVQTAHIANNQVNNNKMAQAAANTIKMNNTAALANLTDFAIPASTVVARLAAGNIVAATPAEMKALLGYAIVVFSDYIIGVTVDPGTDANTSAAAPTLAEMTKTFTPADAANKIEVFFSGTFITTEKKDNDENARCGIFIDGTLQPETERRVYCIDEDEYNGAMSTFWQGTLSAVSHTIDVRFWGTDDTDGVGVLRNLLIRETDE